MLALIAGRGGLPDLIAKSRDCLIIALSGSEPDHLQPDITFRLEQLGSLIADMQARGVTQVCMAGAIDRPNLDPARLDSATKALLPQIMAALGAGDDGALRVVIAILEEAGFKITGAAEICPDLVLSAQLIGVETLSPEIQRDVQVGFSALDARSAQDLGQACVVRDGTVIAAEGPAGTGAMLATLNPETGQAGMLVKSPKIGQELRADMPTIGPDTIKQAATVGLQGVVISAGDVIVLDRQMIQETCAELGLFLWVMAR